MDYQIGFIGAGHMGGALAKSAANVLGNDRVLITNSTKASTDEAAKRLGVTSSDTERILSCCRLIFLGVKPKAIKQVLTDLKPGLLKRPVLLISMAAGVSLSELYNDLGIEKQSFIRMMPNTPVEVGAGMTVWCPGEWATEEDIRLFLECMSATGRLEEMTEPQLDAACALSGCGPAFVYLFLEALADGGVACGLPRAKAMLLAEQTLLGSAEIALKTGKHPGELKDAVCSPGGSTIEGVLSLEQSAFRGNAMSAVIAAYRKTVRK